MKVVRLVDRLDDGLGQFHRPGTTIDEMGTHGGSDPDRRGNLDDCLMLRIKILGKGVDRHDRGDPVAPDDLEMLEEIGGTVAHLVGILFEHLGWEWAARRHLVPTGMDLERPNRRHHDGGIGNEARRSALDVEEAFGPHVGTKTGLGHQVFAGMDPDEIGDDR